MPASTGASTAVGGVMYVGLACSPTLRVATIRIAEWGQLQLIEHSAAPASGSFLQRGQIPMWWILRLGAREACLAWKPQSHRSHRFGCPIRRAWWVMRVLNCIMIVVVACLVIEILPAGDDVFASLRRPLRSKVCGPGQLSLREQDKSQAFVSTLLARHSILEDTGFPIVNATVVIRL